MEKLLLTLALSSFIFFTPAQAEEFWRHGTVVRTLSDRNYGGCMLELSTEISNGCPNKGWVSLDCDAKFSQAGAGDRHYASALIAASMGKKVSILVNNSQKHLGYCVARRVDVIFPQ